MASDPSSCGKFKPAKRHSSLEDVRPKKIARTLTEIPPLNKSPPSEAPEPFIVARDADLQCVFNEVDFPFGVQFEIARILGSKPDHVQPLRHFVEEIRKEPRSTELTRNTDVVAKLHALFEPDARVSKKEASATAPWPALDLEEAVLSRDEHGGVGHQTLTELGLGSVSIDDGNASQYYFGGKVDFIARLDDDFRVSLDKATRAQSNKTKRRFGSTSLIRCKVSDKLINRKGPQVIQFFQRPIVLFNWVFRAFYAKDDSVFLFRTNEMFSDDRVKVNPDSEGLSFLEFIDWLNSLEWNQNQKLSKWATRVSLALSASVPGPLLDRADIHFVDDIVSTTPEKSDMTDGCGLGNLSFFKAIKERFGLPEAPSAVQFRVLGAKGMLLCDRKAKDDGKPEIWLRKSQIKIQYDPDSPVDISHLTVDILRLPRVRTPARLSVEAIICLHHNGVSVAAFVDVLKVDLVRTIELLLDWGLDVSDVPAMLRLWHAVEQSENVVIARRARHDVTNLRFRGYSEQERELLDDDDQDGDVGGRHSTAWWPDPYSGCPSSIAETIMDMLVAGFNPRGCTVLRDKLYRLVKSKITQKCTKHNWGIPESATAFAVPDPYGVLGPNEIHFKSSQREFIMESGLTTDIITGDVLVWRNPCKLPTDVRKVKAVNHPELADILDVVVFPIQGSRRLIDFLAGGDYDGDRVVVMWKSSFVSPFKNAPEEFSLEPPEIKESFTEETEPVKDYRVRFLRRKELGRVKSLQKHLLDGLQDRFLVGMYSQRHDKFTYTHGLDHDKAIREAYMFCSVLDALKSGRKLLPAVRSQDTNYQLKDFVLPWKYMLEKLSSSYDDASNKGPTDLITRNERKLGPFIMDELSKAARDLQREWKARAESIFDDRSERKDEIQSTYLRGADKVLLAPYADHVELAKKRGDKNLQHDLELIKTHVEKMKRKFEEKYGGGSFTAKHIVARQDALRSVSREFCYEPQLEDMKAITDQRTLARVRASYAYELCKSNTGQQFSWMVAFRELCSIKAEASSPFRPVVVDFADNFKLTKAATQA
ncbi:hypothetical protein V5O48_009703 [Marasmius crinis-equi]|uniref:RNA-dependent RNA polymerase n=1 Tax=Marasmius crinis-equi TaxID=585013 RepID=A0ABR3FAD8_9AGAR